MIAGWSRQSALRCECACSRQLTECWLSVDPYSGVRRLNKETAHDSANECAAVAPHFQNRGATCGGLRTSSGFKTVAKTSDNNPRPGGLRAAETSTHDRRDRRNLH